MAYPDPGQPLPPREPAGQSGGRTADAFMDTHILDLSHKPGMEQQSAQDLSGGGGGGGQGLDLSHLPHQQHVMSSRGQSQPAGIHGQLGGQSARLDHQARMELQLGGQSARMGHPMDGRLGGGAPAGPMAQLDQRLGLTHGHTIMSQPHDLSMHGQPPPPPAPAPRYGLPPVSQYSGSLPARAPAIDQYAADSHGSQHRHKAAGRSKSGYSPHQSAALHQPHLQLPPEQSHAPPPPAPPPPPPHLASGIDDLIAGFDLSRPTYSSAPAPVPSAAGSLSAGLSGISSAPLPSFSPVSQLPLPSFSSMASSGGGGSQPAPVREPLPQPMDTAPSSAPPPPVSVASSSAGRLAEEPFPWELSSQYPASYSRELGYAGYPPYSMGYSQPPGGYGAPAPYPGYGLYGAASAAGYSPYRYPAGYQAFGSLGGAPFGGLGGVAGLPQPYEPTVSAADFSLGGSMSAPGEPPTYRRPQ